MDYGIEFGKNPEILSVIIYCHALDQKTSPEHEDIQLKFND